MPQNITDVNTWTTPLVDLADGDLIDGAAFLAAQQGVGNRTEYLRKKVFASEAGENINVPLTPMPQSTVRWEWNSHASGGWGLQQNSAASAYICALELPQPKVATLTDIIITLAGQTGHAGDPPATTMPRVQLYRQSRTSTAAPTLVGTVTDATATSAAYEVAHSISITGLSEALLHDGGNRFYLELRGETGGNAIGGLTILDILMAVDPA